ncbi:MAG: phenylacetate-CoA oxygenase subunit PaaI [Limnohabitans sp.]|nr:phenylacetate-CoA oxygenase subunit PaaI [Limnohabitans sp.]
MNSLPEFVLHLADNALILGQRNAECCGHGPILEEDLALANNALDLIGQARLLYQHVAQLRDDGSTEDSLAYFRDQQHFLNFTLLELPHTTALAPSALTGRDYAVTITRNGLFSAYMLLVWEQLQGHADAQLAAIAVKSLKEVRYHWQHAADWLLRFGGGTDESHARAQAAVNFLMPYTQEFWSAKTPVQVFLNHTQALQAAWQNMVGDLLAQAALQMPPDGGFIPHGSCGIHSEHMSYLLAEMQSLARQHPGAAW